MSTNESVAVAWAAGLANGDLLALAPLTSPNMRVWHSTDGLWLTAAESQARMAEAAQAAPAAMPGFEQVRSHVIPTGFVIQATMNYPGAPPTHIAQVCTVDNGVVVACEEYIAAQTAAP